MYVVHSPARVSKGDLLMVRQAHHERMLGYARSLLDHTNKDNIKTENKKNWYELDDLENN
jgi:hypothetical protein